MMCSVYWYYQLEDENLQKVSILLTMLIGNNETLQ